VIDRRCAAIAENLMFEILALLFIVGFFTSVGFIFGYIAGAFATQRKITPKATARGFEVLTPDRRDPA